jgi:hypothetical protein
MRVPVMMLTLKLANQDGSTRTVHMELSKDELDKLLDDCENINEVVARLRI